MNSRSATQPIQGQAGAIHVDDGGTGNVPVVFLHSYAGDSRHWENQLEHLRSKRRAIAIDLRGHGQSAAPKNADYSIPSLMRDLEAVVEALDLRRFVLVGHSMGGSIAVAYAGAHTDKVAGLVLAGTPGKTPPEMADQVMKSMEQDYEKVSQGYWNKLLANGSPEVQSRIKREIGSVPREASLKIIRALFDYNPIPALKAYPGPKLILFTPDGDTPTALHRAVSGLNSRQISGTSHWMHLDIPNDFNRILDEFLDTVG